MTNSHTEYQPLHGVKARNYLLITLAATLAVVGAVCIYQTQPTKNHTLDLVFNNQDCKNLPELECTLPLKATQYFYEPEWCFKYACCPDAPPRLTNEQCDRRTHYALKSLNADNCDMYSCCQKKPRCRGYTTKTEGACKVYTCPEGSEAAEKALECKPDEKVTRFAGKQFCCPKKQVKRFHCDKETERFRSKYINGCKIGKCCKKAPKCKNGHTVDRTDMCWVYTCK